ncbi:hypothetical protein AAAT94_07630 [Intestinimonas aquisgranensis]|nr:hypothetical protein [Intestinimonas aquisgranensis]
MRTASILLDGKEYPMCFSTRVVRACSERYGGVEHIGAALSGEDLMKVLDETLWLLAAMLDAGARYARLNGQEPLPPPDQETLYDLCDMEDLAGLKSRVMAGMAAGASHTVEARPPKNGETAQGPVEIRD